MNRTVRRSSFLAVAVAALVACSDHAKELLVGPKLDVGPKLALNKTPPAAVLDTFTVGDLTVTSSALSEPAFAQDGLIGPPISGLPDRGGTATAVRVGFGGCNASNFAGFPSGTVALIARGGCTFATKVANAQTAGAGGVVVYQYPIFGDTLTTMFGGSTGIPALFIGNTAGVALDAATPVSITVIWSPFNELAAWVGQLDDAGLLKKGQAKSLMIRLDHARSPAGPAADRDRHSIKELNAFIKEVEGLVKSNTIAEADGLVMISAANDAITVLST